MSRDHVSHADLVRFADERVNLKRDDAADLRAQGNRLRDRLETYLADHPDFALRKMMLSGTRAVFARSGRKAFPASSRSGFQASRRR